MGIGTNNQSIQQLCIHRNISMLFTKGNIFLEYDCIVLVLPGTSIIRTETTKQQTHFQCGINPLNPELNPICYLLALLAHHFLHVSRIRVKSLTLRLLMSYIYIYIYIYGAPILDVSRSHTTTQHSR